MGTLKDAATVIKQRKPKVYCWEFIKYGPVPGGLNKAAELRICPRDNPAAA